MTYGAKTATSTNRKHLTSCHLEAWVMACKRRNISIKNEAAQRAAEGIQPDSADRYPRKPYSKEAFVDSIVEFIVGDDLVCSFAQSHHLSSLYRQSLNVVESPRLRAIFKMLRAELRESDIPCHTTIRTWIGEVFKEHLDQLEDEMKVSIMFIVHINAHSFSRYQLGRSHSLWTCGPTPISHPPWR